MLLMRRPRPPQWLPFGLKPSTISATIDGKALLVGGDILLSVLGMRIGDSSDEEIQERLSALPAGSLVRLTVLRDGRQVELSAPR
jgi:S1-C subfamily serine protease